MSRKIIYGKSTGIYREATVRIDLKREDGNPSARGIKEAKKFFRELTKARDIYWQLDQWDQIAKDTIAKYGGNHNWPPAVPKNAPPMARDAIQLLSSVLITRDHLKEARAKNQEQMAKNLAIDVLELGRLIERIRVRPFETFTRTGIKNREATRKGGREKARLWNSEYRKEHWQTEAEELSQKYPYQSWTQIKSKIATKYGISIRTVTRSGKRNPRKSNPPNNPPKI